MDLVSTIEILGLIFLISFTFMGTVTLALISQDNIVVWVEPNLIIRFTEILGGIFGIAIAAKIILKKIRFL
jgi:putative Mn2+ efflux pump MntP